MLTERARKKVAIEHSRRLSAGDIDALLELYAADATFEDPVGSGRQAGHQALRAHFEPAVAAGTRETIEDSTVGHDGRSVLTRLTAEMDYGPLGPLYAERGWLPAPTGPGPEPARLRCHSAMLLHVGASGLIEDMQGFFGRGDLETSPDGSPGSYAGPEKLSPGEVALRQMTRNYTDLLNDGEVDRVAELFTEDVVFEDPVGRTTLHGRQALREHLHWAAHAGVREVPSRSVTAMEGPLVVTATDVRLHLPQEMSSCIISISEMNEDGLGVHVRAYWGLTDVTMGVLPARDTTPEATPEPLARATE
ncbi:nuclear transport factor 2 family protein [Streptomyces sp. NPDC000941]